MDEAGIESAGVAPMQARARRDREPEIRRAIFRNFSGGCSWLFAASTCCSASAPTRTTRIRRKIIALASAGGLGFRTETITRRPMRNPQETRAEILEHMQQMFGLLGDSSQAAIANAKIVMEIETALAEASLTRVDRRDPYKLDHKLSKAQLQALTPSFRWDALSRGQRRASDFVVNVTEPKFYQEVQSLLKSRSLEDWKTYLRWHLVHDKAQYLSPAFVNANFDFYGKYLRGVKEMQPRWQRCVRFVDANLGEALGQVFVEKTFTPETKQRTLRP